jgi:hypothetical protein
MKNTGQIFRSKKNGKSRYTPINNDILQSKILTPEQKSILVHLLSLPEDWVVYKTEIWKDMNIGRDRFNKSWTGLVKLGYIVSVKMIDTNSNLIKGYNHLVYEEPTVDSLTVGLTENQVSRTSGSIQSNNSQSNNLQSNNIEGMQNLSNSLDFNDLNGLLTDSDLRVLQENYSYIMWSILAVGLLTITINTMKK